MKKIMIVGASILQLSAIRQAKEMGLSVIAVDMNPEAIGFKENGVICEVISTIDIPAVVKAAKKHQIDGIMTLASDMPMRTIAAVSKEMRLVGVSEETAFRATNKAAMRNSLAEYGVPIPTFYKVSTWNEFINAVNKIRETGSKVIVKPADNSGSRGVDLLNTYSDEEMKMAYCYSKEYSRLGDLIVEEYMEGPEVSVETLTVDGICHVIQITDKLTTGAPYFVEMGHSEPSQLDESVCEKIREVAVAANKAIGITNGPSHTEIKVTASGPKIVELGARLGGDNIATHLVPLSTGVNMVECCIKIALGDKPDIVKKFESGSAIRYLECEEGTIHSIYGVEEAEKIPGVQQISFVHGVGDRAVPIQSSVDRVGFVIAKGEDVISAIDMCNEALRKIKVEIEGPINEKSIID